MNIVKRKPCLEEAFNSLTKRFKMKDGLDSGEFSIDTTVYTEIIDLENPIEEKYLFFFHQK